jgi:hypothetical protein
LPIGLQNGCEYSKIKANSCSLYTPTFSLGYLFSVEEIYRDFPSFSFTNATSEPGEAVRLSSVIDAEVFATVGVAEGA